MKKRILGITIAWIITGVGYAQTVPDFINFQGKLMDGTNLFNGTVPIVFRLYDSAEGGDFPHCVDSNDVTVVDGLYATCIGDDVTWGSLDNALSQDQVWIELEIDGQIVAPRERLAGVGYARYAAKLPANAVDMAMIAPDAVRYWHIADNQVRANHLQSGSVSDQHLADGSISSAKYGFESVDLNALGQNAVQFWHIADNQVRSNHIRDGSVSNEHLADGAITGDNVAAGTLEPGHLDLADFDTTFWKSEGNTGTTAGLHFIGTSDSVPLDLRVGNTTGLRLQPGTPPSLIGGDAGNAVLETDGAVIGGGRENSISTNSAESVIGGGRQNTIGNSTYQAFIGAGYQNSLGADSDRGAVAGGWGNGIADDSRYSFIGAGLHNDIGTGSQAGTLAGGGYNDIGDGSPYGAIGGGYNNEITEGARAATIPGGEDNVAGADWALAAGRQARATNVGAFVWADSQDVPFGSTGGDQFLVRAGGGVGIGTPAPIAPLDVVGFGGDVFNHNTDALVARFMHENEWYGAEISICGRGGEPALNLCRSGEVKWTAYARFNDNFRLRYAPSSTDALELEPEGHLTITGDMTAKTYHYATVRTNSIFLSGADFQNVDPTFENYEISLDGIVYDIDETDARWDGVTGVNLPQGATVIRMTAYYHVATSGGTAMVLLRRHRLASMDATTMAELLETTGFSGLEGEVQTLSTRDISYPVVDHDNNRYTVSARLDIDNFMDVTGFIGVKIEYSFQEVRP